MGQGWAKTQLQDLGCLGLGWTTESRGLAMMPLRSGCLGLGWVMVTQAPVTGWLRLGCRGGAMVSLG